MHPKCQHVALLHLHVSECTVYVACNRRVYILYRATADCQHNRVLVAGAQACTALDVDLITFDMARRLPFRLRPGPLQAAVKRGVHLEICYAAALRDETSRRNFFSNASGAPDSFGISTSTLNKDPIMQQSIDDSICLRWRTVMMTCHGGEKASVLSGVCWRVQHLSGRRGGME